MLFFRYFKNLTSPGTIELKTCSQPSKFALFIRPENWPWVGQSVFVLAGKPTIGGERVN